ncbi:hypothetical protein [Euzebya pacifica]|nr:hypothetical protein [Euzebya pacifica]
MNLTRLARRRRTRGVEIVQLAVVLVVVGILTSVSYGLLREPADAARDNYVDTTLRAIDLEARARARQSQSGNPAEHLLTVVADTITIPEQELALAVEEEQRFRLVVVRDAPSLGDGRVVLLRFGSCAALEVDPTGRRPGDVDFGACEATDVIAGGPFGD